MNQIHGQRNGVGLFKSKMKPFDHVIIANMEFMLWYKNDGQSFFENDCDEWDALDLQKRKVGISERLAHRLPSQCTHYGVWVHKPKFFGERLVDNQWHEFEIKNAQMISDVQNNRTCGEFTKNGIVWKWNIKDLTLFKDNERWLLRVMTPGGYWL